jgi:DNA-binding CsgD family transcriptional regulator
MNWQMICSKLASQQKQTQADRGTRMSDLDSTVLLAATQLSLLNGHLVTLLERLNQRLSIEGELTLASAKSGGEVQAELLGALKLQKQAVAENFALVRAMLRQQRRQRRVILAQQRNVTSGEPVERSLSPRGRLIEVSGGLNLRAPESNGQSFTKRQREIISLVKLGYDNREIAESLSLAEQTVKNHLCTIFGKAGVSRRADLATHMNQVDELPKSALDDWLSADEAGSGSLTRSAHN